MTLMPPADLGPNTLAFSPYLFLKVLKMEEGRVLKVALSSMEKCDRNMIMEMANKCSLHAQRLSALDDQMFPASNEVWLFYDPVIFPMASVGDGVLFCLGVWLHPAEVIFVFLKGSKPSIFIARVWSS